METKFPPVTQVNSKLLATLGVFAIIFVCGAIAIATIKLITTTFSYARGVAYFAGARVGPAQE